MHETRAVVTNFKNKSSAGGERAFRCNDETRVKVQALISGEKRFRRSRSRTSRGSLRRVLTGHVGRIADEQIESLGALDAWPSASAADGRMLTCQSVSGARSRGAQRFSGRNQEPRSEMSVATISACCNSEARAIAMHPEPVPISATRMDACAAFPSAKRDLDHVLGLRPGDQNPRATSNSSPQNPWLPVKYCVGTPLARRSINSAYVAASSEGNSYSGWA